MDEIFISSWPMADVLKKRKVLASCGSRHGFPARRGSNYRKFLARMLRYKRAIVKEE